jgi:low density lipoprotein receptor-related protein 5/6
MRSLVQLLTVLLVTVLQGASPHPWLLFANRKDIRLVDASAAKNRNNNVTVIIKDLEDAAALDYHYDKGMVCWTDISLEMIRCAFHQGANVINKTNVITTGTSIQLCII